MGEFKRNLKPLIILSICAVFIGGIWFFRDKMTIFFHYPDRNVQEQTGLDKLLAKSSEIHRLWIEGEESREWKSFGKECLDYLKITSAFDESLLRCNPILLQCLNQFEKKKGFRFLPPPGNEASQKIYRYLTKANSNFLIPHSGYLFTIEEVATQRKLNLLLSDQCHEVFLQNRAYAYGEDAGEEDYRFDNFNQNIYVDRHLVTNDQINEWIEFGSRDLTRGLVKKEGDLRFFPATELTTEQMANFCSFSGKQLLMAHIFDAATFLPMDLNELVPKKNNRSPYYWTKKKSDFKKDCNLFYANECLSKKSFQLNSTYPSWAGVLDSMGGVMEAYRNPIDPESNLKASSYYFNFSSPWHKLGFRARWDGEGFDIRHFDFKGIDPSIIASKLQVGFRCMRESK